jgi:hypothetical protein
VQSAAGPEVTQFQLPWRGGAIAAIFYIRKYTTKPLFGQRSVVGIFGALLGNETVEYAGT